jgi:hypothetical protein
MTTQATREETSVAIVGQAGDESPAPVSWRHRYSVRIPVSLPQRVILSRSGCRRSR